ncbi:PKD domain-containing protein, partial [Lentimicrobium sp. S6]|uniref:PKD domain-containing protein n=1 Tax=Lentimicrobium sp. S6 TaxID=2735872 RepID=UPI001555DA76
DYGSHDIQLIVESNQACRDTALQSIMVHPKPQAAFDAPMVCFGNTTVFDNLSDGFGDNLTSYLWQIEAQSFSDENPSFNFASHGNQEVELIVTSQHNCKDTLLQNVIVDSLPIAQFSYTNPCKSDVVTISNLSDGNGKNLQNYFWDFDNGSTSSQEELIYIYPSPGTYQITLQITDENGCQDEIIKPNVRVYPNFDVQILAPDFCIDQTGTLLGEATPTGITLDNWHWNIHDGSSIDQQNISQTFTAAGNYTYQLIGNIDTCTAGQEVEIDIRELPTSDFSYTGQCLESPIAFTDNSTGDGLSLTNWQWDFGEGSSSTLSNPSHTYNNSGNYPVQLTVTDAHGCQSSETQNLYFRDLPQANFQAQWPLCEGNEIQFQNQSQSPGTILSYNWDLDDGITTGEINPSHTYNNGGNKEISLIIIDDWQCSDTLEQSLYITPEFSLGIDYWGLCTNTPASLSGRVIAPLLSPDTWSWTFEDGSQESGQNIHHIFTQQGENTVQLLASKNGCEEVHEQVLLVSPCPTANFIYSLVSLDDTVSFQDISTLNGGPAIISWNWEFGDPMSGLENYSTLQHPEHLFSHLGDFDVTLTVTDGNGCIDDTTMTLSVNPRPVAGFYWENSCFGSDVQFVDTSSTSQGFVTNWWWDFGDPTSGAFNFSTAQNPTHAFTAPGIYDVQLITKAFG